MDTHDTKGRPWAKLSELKVGDKIETDVGFDCIGAETRFVCVDDDGLYFVCKEGRHYLTGQTVDDEHLIGIYKVQS